MLALAGCAAQPVPGDSVVPGTIGVMVTHAPAGVLVTESRSVGLRAGDVVLRYNGEAISGPRQFYRLVIDSRPGSVARLHVLRDGGQRVVDVPVEQLDTAPRT